MFKHKKSIATLSLFFAFLLAGCQSSNDNQTTVEENTSVIETVEETQAASAEGTIVEVKGNENSKMSYKITVPESGWQVIEFSGNHPSAQFVKAETSNDISSSSPILSVSIASENLTADEVKALFVKPGDDIEVTDYDLNGIAAWTFEKTLFSNPYQYIVAELNGHSIEIYVTKTIFDDPQVQAMITSLEFDAP